jgi:hypothetical protein
VPPQSESPHAVIDPSALSITAWGTSRYGGKGAPFDNALFFASNLPIKPLEQVKIAEHGVG